MDGKKPLCFGTRTMANQIGKVSSYLATLAATVALAGCNPDPASPDPVLRQVTVGKTGNGQGTIISAPIGINCGGICDSPVDGRVALTLTATPASGSVFVSWTGDCAPTPNPCTIPAGGTAVGAIARFEVGAQ
jgi:hypothetical protein